MSDLQESFDRLVCPWAKWVQLGLRRLDPGRLPEEYEDMESEVWLSAWNRWPRYDSALAAVSTWLSWDILHVVSHAKRDRQQGRKGFQAGVLSLEEACPFHDPVDLRQQTEQQAIQAHLLGQALEALALLGEREQDIIHSRLEGTTYLELARRYQVSDFQIRTWEQRAHEAIRQILQVKEAAP